MGTMGEVVGEALGGEFLHQFGHGVGTVLLVWLLAGAGWLLLRDHAPWVTRWAWAGAAGSAAGLLVYLPVLTLAPESELTIWLSFFLPLGMAAMAQARAVQGHIGRPGRWAGAWFLAVLLGTGVAWFAGGGLAGAVAGYPHPVLEKAVAFFWRLIPRNLLGGVLYAGWTAWAVPIAPRREEQQ